MTPAELLSRLGPVKKAGAGYSARCPAHEDHDPSLSVTFTDDRILLHCHAGCHVDDICKALDVSPADLFLDEHRPNHNGDGTAYDYVDEVGRLLFQVVRKPGKRFAQRHREGGEWVWNLNGTRRVLYRLPKVIEAVGQGRTVFVVEGEKDVHSVEAAGEVATCNPGGAGKWRREYADFFTGAEVFVVADRDEPGRKHAQQVAAALAGKAASVTVCEPVEGKDVSDHLAAGHRLDDLAVVADPEAPVDVEDFFIDWAVFWAKDRREPDWLYDDVLARGRGHSIYAAHKVGKSLFALYTAARLATRGAVVLYLDYEMSEDDLYDRLEAMGYGPDSDLSRLRYALLPNLAPLDGPEGAKELLALVDAAQAAWPASHVVVVIDTTGRAVSGEENDADTIRDFYRHTGLGLKQRGVTWARLDHAGKDPTKGQRGSSAKGDDVDVVWHITRTENGMALHRSASRIGWAPDKVTFRQVDEPLRFVRVDHDWPEGTKEVADLLDELGVPLEAGERPAAKALRDAGQARRATIVRAAQKWRRVVAEKAF